MCRPPRAAENGSNKLQRCQIAAIRVRENRAMLLAGHISSVRRVFVARSVGAHSQLDSFIIIGTFRSGAMADAGFFRVCCHHFNAVFVATCVVSNRPQYSSSAHHHHHTRARVWSRTTASQTRTRSCSSPSSSSPSWTPRCALRPSSSSMAFRSC